MNDQPVSTPLSQRQRPLNPPPRKRPVRLPISPGAFPPFSLHFPTNSLHFPTIPPQLPMTGPPTPRRAPGRRIFFNFTFHVFLFHFSHFPLFPLSTFARLVKLTGGSAGVASLFQVHLHT